MNEDQFLILQSAVQFAADSEDGLLTEGPKWEQQHWAVGTAVGRPFLNGLRAYQTVEVSCGSACCIAGNIAMQTGASFLTKGPGASVDRVDRVLAGYVNTPDGRVETVGGYAARMIGVGDDWAEALFAGSNDLDGVILVATELAARWGFELHIARKEQ